MTSTKTCMEIMVDKPQSWTCPPDVKMVVMYKSRSNYKVVQVKQGVTYTITEHSFGDNSLNVQEPGFNILWVV